MKHHYPANRPCDTAGYSLIELMVAMTIGVVALSATMGMYTNYKSGIRATENTLTMQTNARFAFDFIAGSLRDVGSFGCLSSRQYAIGNTNAEKLLDGQYIGLADKSTVGADFHFGKDVEGYDASGSAWLPMPVLPYVADMTPGSDAIKIVSAIGNVYVPVGAEILETDTEIQLDMTGVGRVDLVSGGYAIVSDCSNAHIFQVTSTNGDIQGGLLSHGAGTGAGNEMGSFERTYKLDGTTNTNGFQSRGGSTGTVEIRRIATISYYIAENDAGIPTLYRDVDQKSTPLVPGVERMQIEYGVNTLGRRNVADVYLDAQQIDAGTDPVMWANVVSVRISLTMRSYDPVYDKNVSTKTYSTPLTDGSSDDVTPDDRYARYKFTSTVALRNRMIGSRVGSRSL